MKEPLFHITHHTADDPEGDGDDCLLFEEAVRQYPDFARLLLDPHFSSLDLVIDLTHIRIERLEPENWPTCPDCQQERTPEEWTNGSDICDECFAEKQNEMALIDEYLRQEAWSGDEPFIQEVFDLGDRLDETKIDD